MYLQSSARSFISSTLRSHQQGLVLYTRHDFFVEIQLVRVGGEGKETSEDIFIALRRERDCTSIEKTRTNYNQ